jgi:hypothetical protein
MAILAGLEFRFSKTQSAFINSNAVVNAIISNTGEGKTFAGVMAILRHAERCGKAIRCAIVRDTHENIKNSTVVSIQEAFEQAPHLLKWKNDYKQLYIRGGAYPIRCDLFGLNELGSLGKLQGPEYALIWLEEPAPMADRVNAGLPVEVYRASLVRCARQKGTVPRLQISMNPADQDHWSYRELIEAPDVLPEYPLITKRIFFVPYGENRHVSEVSRQAVKMAYKDDPASYQRYVKGQFAAIIPGKAVTPQYNRSRHLSPDRLWPARGLTSFAFFDGWHNPSCVLGQITTNNRLIFIDTLKLAGGDIGTLIETQVLPLLNSPKWKDKARSWRIGGDPTMATPDQSNVQRSAAKVVEEYFPGCSFEKGPTRWATRKIGIANALRGSDPRGEPLVYLSADNRILDKALAGSWHYKVDNSGNPVGQEPEKDEISHPADAWCYAVCVLLSTVLPKVDSRVAQEAARRAQARAASYAAAARMM